ncbi:glycosyltransferase family 4 protein [bacterium]|nr:glycosyltransferase family 4 protein [bacterium]
MNHRVILGFEHGVLGGVDIFSLNLLEELTRRNVATSILVTNHFREQPYALPLPQNLPIHKLPIRKSDPWPARWQEMIRFLEAEAPCIYIPNYDFNYSCVAPKLSKNVIIAGIVHSDDPVHYEHFLRMGKYWNGVVSVSKEIAERLKALDPTVSDRLVTIPYGVPISGSFPERRDSDNAPLRIVYAGRLVQRQKQVLLLPEIFERIVEQESNIEITIIGDGPERGELMKRCENLSAKGLIRFAGKVTNQDLLRHFSTQDVVVLVSDFEGMPVSILEAMGQGCVPVVSEIRSGIPEIIRDGHNGFIVSAADSNLFAQRIVRLARDRSLRQTLSFHAYNTIRDHYELKQMGDKYLRLFERLTQKAANGTYVRPKGPITYPKSLRVTWKDQLPKTVRLVGRYGKTLLKRIGTVFEINSPKNRT